jgi:hypothetical protein
MPVCTNLNLAFFADYVDESRLYKNLYFKLSKIPYANGETDRHHRSVSGYIFQDRNASSDVFGRTPLRNAVSNGDKCLVFLNLHHHKVSTNEDQDIMTPLHIVACQVYLLT